MSNLFRTICCNHSCKLNDACQNYDNKLKESDKAEYIRPRIFFDPEGRPKIYCKEFFPFNLDHLIQKNAISSDSPGIRKKKVIKRMFEIIKEYGNDKKVELNRDLKQLMALNEKK